MSQHKLALDAPLTVPHEELTREQFLPHVAWRKSADRNLVKAAAIGDEPAFTQALRTSLKTCGNNKTSPSTTRQTLSQLLQPLWSQHAWDDHATSDVLSELLTALHNQSTKPSKKGAKTLVIRVNDALAAAPPDVSPWALLVWLTILASSSELLDDQTLLAIWRQSLLEVATQLTDIRETTPMDDLEFCDDRQLLLTGELPWLAGLVLADVKGSPGLRKRGRNELRAQLEASTDADGTPHARLLRRLPLALAVFTRSLAAGNASSRKLFDRLSLERYEQLVTQAVLIAHCDGRLALSNGASFATGSLLRTATRLSGLRQQEPSYRRVETIVDDAPTRRVPKQRLPKLSTRSKQVRKSKATDCPSSQSDWAELTCMRNNWLEGGDSCIVAHHDVLPQISVTGFERTLIDGDWGIDVDVDGTAVELIADWSCVCWYSDEDADYLELQQQTTGGLTLQRQVLLSRTDHWLFLADTARLDSPSKTGATPLSLTMRLPLAASVTGQQERWTRDISLKSGKLRASVYPLSLEQERVQKANGSLEVVDGVITLSQSTNCGSLHMPLVIDWSPDRQLDDAQWKQLTVAEDGQRLLPHIASGQRLRVGRHQWLFYRSLLHGDTGRSILGHHTNHETVIAEFSGTGEVEPIVVVEHEDETE